MVAPALVALLALTCARAGDGDGDVEGEAGVEAQGGGCMYSGRWFAEGGGVRVRDACLRCRCARGLLACARAACAPPPDPPPRRCVVLHRRDTCCPELHCPDVVKSLELEATARLEEESWDAATAAGPAHACAEAGGVFAAGSALAARAACETCFCLRGVRRCVRPRCLPAPAACAPRPAPGACCPARYYCHTNGTSTRAPLSSTPAHRPHDCLVNGEWVREGEAVPAAAAAAAGAGECARCFCLRGATRCQPLRCAPARALRGCTPLLRPGHCCPHQYHCPHDNELTASYVPTVSDNALSLSRSDERSLRSSAAALLSSSAPAAAPTGLAIDSTSTKVKRKTLDSLPPAVGRTATTPNITQALLSATTDNTSETPAGAPTAPSPPSASTTEHSQAQTPAEHLEGSVKIMINGTINCTTELSSTLPTNTTNDTDNVLSETKPRVPELADIEAQSSAPVEVITDRGVGGGGGFDVGDSFVVNVTSSLLANSSREPSPPAAPAEPAADPSAHAAATNTKEDYDYDYTEPTLPPSLPNLKIIPFVAADAVVDDDPPKAETYPLLEREDKFPVLYPTVEHRAVPFASRREDVHHPVFVAKEEHGHTARPQGAAGRAPPAAASAGPTSAATLTTPGVNLFSPPAKTEGGFIPKGPGIIDEYYAVYPSTPPPVPHLTTSMQINPDTPDKMECVTSDGRRVADGESVRLACAACACAWGELTCAPRPRRCPAPPPRCWRRPPAVPSHHLCCGELVCDHNSTATLAPSSGAPARGTETALALTRAPEAEVTATESELIPFEPPPDRSVPEVHNSSAETKDKIKSETNTYRNITVANTDDSLKQKLHIYNTTEKIQSTPVTAAVKPTPSTETPPSTLFSRTSAAPAPSPPATSPAAAALAPAPPAPPAPYGGDNSSQEYDDDEEDDGFSFGSVLKLLLSDNYDTTTVSSPKQKPSAATASTSSATSTQRPPSRRPALKPAMPPFVPMQPHAYIPPKNFVPQNALNRIDHLVLGEATAIKKSTTSPSTSQRPATAPFRPASTTTRKAPTTRTTGEVIAAEGTTERYTPVPPPGAGAGAGGGVGLLKLAGCNIYGRMYRVGRIIAELSTPCQECRCTELGVQCEPLRC